MSQTILTEVVNQTGIIKLNRHAAYNALNLDMIRELTVALSSWEEDPEIRCIIVESNHPKAFCAGGDMKTICELGQTGELDIAEQFFIEEYALNLLTSQLQTPYVSLIDGMCIGGGIGLTVHGKYSIATERSRFTMPECKLGFFPDIGGSYFLPRMRHNTGFYLALSGEFMSGTDSVVAKLCTHHVPADKLVELRTALINTTDSVDSIIEQFNIEPPIDKLQDNLLAIESSFGADSLIEVSRRLQEIDSPWAKKTLSQIRAASWHSVQTSWLLLKRGKTLDLPTCLEVEIATSRLFTIHPDFFEGVRSILIDKDRKPVWTKACTI